MGSDAAMLYTGGTGSVNSRLMSHRMEVRRMTTPKTIVLENYVGKQFGRLIVLGLGDRDKYGQQRWKCLCSCGKEVLVNKYRVAANRTKSCGCIGRESFIARSKARTCKQDLTGRVFGRLTVICLRNEGRLKKTRFWLCRCECGKETVVSKFNLFDGLTKSCGCLHRDELSIISTTHGQSKTRTYHIWQGMHARCTNPNAQGWKNYGGRGITVCPEWKVFENFLRDMGECPPGKSIDRYPNNDGNYAPGNCRWATNKEQAENKRKRYGGKCKRGHIVADGNVISVSNGKRGGVRIRCKTCLRSAQNAWQIKHRREQCNAQK